MDIFQPGEIVKYHPNYLRRTEENYYLYPASKTNQWKEDNRAYRAEVVKQEGNVVYYKRLGDTTETGSCFSHIFTKA